MVQTKTITFYIFFLILFSFFYSMILTGEGEGFNPQDYLLVTKIRAALSEENGFISRVINAVLIPFLLFDALIFLVSMIGFSFVAMPIYVSTLLLTPLGMMIVFEYILPYVRGN